jgi:hypothetical protein
MRIPKPVIALSWPPSHMVRSPFAGAGADCTSLVVSFSGMSVPRFSVSSVPRYGTTQAEDVTKYRVTQRRAVENIAFVGVAWKSRQCSRG